MGLSFRYFDPTTQESEWTRNDHHLGYAWRCQSAVCILGLWGSSKCFEFLIWWLCISYGHTNRNIKCRIANRISSQCHVHSWNISQGIPLAGCVLDETSAWVCQRRWSQGVRLQQRRVVWCEDPGCCDSSLGPCLLQLPFLAACDDPRFSDRHWSICLLSL